MSALLIGNALKISPKYGLTGRLRLFSSSFKPLSVSSHMKSKTPKTARVTNNIQRLRRVNKTNLFNNQGLGNYSEKFKTNLSPCVTITSCERYDLDNIVTNSQSIGFKIQTLIPNAILHFKYNQDVDILVLSSGSIVGWGIEEEALDSEIIPLFKQFMISPYDFPESEDMDFVESLESPNEDSKSHLIGEVIIISAGDKDQALLDKAAFSSGLSRSTRLAVLENSLERHISTTRKITENLSTGTKVTITEKEVLRLTGRLFLLRAKLNLYSELIEIPDLYWSEPTLEKIYKDTSNILDITPRISILNTKLDYATDESRALMSTLNEQKSTRLEWIIIYLIMIEVCFEIHHFYERYYLDQRDTKKEPSL